MLSQLVKKLSIFLFRYHQAVFQQVSLERLRRRAARPASRVGV
jgi:hypothetical protein